MRIKVYTRSSFAQIIGGISKWLKKELSNHLMGFSLATTSPAGFVSEVLDPFTFKKKLKWKSLAVGETNLNENCLKQKHISTECLMAKENMELTDEISCFNFKGFIQIALMKNTVLEGLGHCLNLLLAEHFSCLSDLLLCCILPWKPKRNFHIAMETNQYNYIYILFVDHIV